MKSNKYVYPTTEFSDLADKKIKNNIDDKKEINTSDLAMLARRAKMPRLKIRGKSTAEKIVNMFLDEECLFGPASYIIDNRDYWINKFENFIKQNKPIKMTILGFPFKMPVALKTDRKLPDMGEVLSIVRLAGITENIKKVYKNGVVIYIFTEGGFGSFAGVTESDWKKYERYLKKLVDQLGLSERIKILALSQMEKLPEFSETFEKRFDENKSMLEKNDKEFLEKYNDVYLPMFRIVNTEGYDQGLLMDVYNEELADSDVPNEVLAVRKEIRKKTQQCILKYFAYLKTRDDLDYIERTVRDHIALSVSPKPMRLGVIPINRKCIRLPYHGVPVYHKKKKTWSIEYLIDLRRSKKKYIAVFWKDDGEKKPFYYIEK